MDLTNGTLAILTCRIIGTTIKYSLRVCINERKRRRKQQKKREKNEFKFGYK